MVTPGHISSQTKRGALGKLHCRMAPRVLGIGCAESEPCKGIRMNTKEIQNISNGDAGMSWMNAVPDFSLASGLIAESRDGELLPFVTGKESDSALRDLAIYFAEGYPSSRRHPSSPFSILSGHYRASLKILIHGMTRAALLSLFEMERQLRQSAMKSAAGPQLTFTS